MKVSFETVNGEIFLVVGNRENGVESYRAKVHEFQDANGLQRFTLCGPGEFEIAKKNDLLGFVVVDPEDLPLRTRFNAVMTNASDLCDVVGTVLGVIRSNIVPYGSKKRKKKWAQVWNEVKQELGKSMPKFFRLGVVKSEDSTLPVWAGGFWIVEEKPIDRDTIGYFPRSKRTKDLQWDTRIDDYAFCTRCYEVEEDDGLSKVWRYEIRRSEWERISDSVPIRHLHNAVGAPWNSSNLLVYLTVANPKVDAKSIDVQRVKSKETPNIRNRRSKVTA